MCLSRMLVLSKTSIRERCFYMYGIRNKRKRNNKRKKKLRIGILLILLSLGCASIHHVVSADNYREERLEVFSEEINAAGLTKAEVQLLEPASAAEPEAPLIVLDPGHGGGDEGCAREGVKEKDANLQLGLLLKEKLEELGYRVLMTRDEDVSRTLEERAEMANEAAADLYVSIHQNACETEEPSGVETWYSTANEGEDSRRIARLIQMYTVQATGAQDRDVLESSSLYVIRETSMPSCLVETGFLSNPEERTKLGTTEYQEKVVNGIAAGIDYYFHPKTMYLTFDDGPSEENTARILDILKKYDIKATFFLVGENVEKHPEIARRIAAEGHTIGIHCNRHEYDVIYESVESYLEDFETARQTVYEVTGVEAQLFRFPGGSINAYNKDVYEEIIEEMTNRGYIYFDWNASLEDAVSDSDPETLVRNARETTLGRKKVVMLAHDIVYNTSLCLENLLDAFPDYKFEALTPEVAPIQFK